IHAGQEPDPLTGAVVPPIYQVSTYAQDAVGAHRGYEYSRTANPTRTALERCLASLESASHGLAFASGMAAEDALLRLLRPVDHPERADALAFVQNAAGAVPGPFDCFLVLRGIKTLAVRMERHCHNARVVAGMLAEHPAVARVLYPGLAEHPGHDVAARQMHDFGGMVSFTLAAGEAAAVELVARTRVFTLAESLGGVESLVE